MDENLIDKYENSYAKEEMSMKLSKKIIAIMICFVTIFSFTSLCSANITSASWDVDYTPGAPTQYSNQSDRATLNYYSGGYVANCSSITGAQGRMILVSSASCGGISGGTKYITTTGNTARFYLNGSTTGTIKITFEAKTGYRCDANGTVHI